MSPGTGTVTPTASNSKAQGRGTPRTLGCGVAKECRQTPKGLYILPWWSLAINASRASAMVF